jgi:hypothetical protein
VSAARLEEEGDGQGGGGEEARVLQILHQHQLACVERMLHLLSDTERFTELASEWKKVHSSDYFHQWGLI